MEHTSISQYGFGSESVPADIFESLACVRQKTELAMLSDWNKKTEVFGLTLTEAQATELIRCRNDSLKRHRRVEFGQGILDKLIFAFCDSDFVMPDVWPDTLAQLQDIFYQFKNLTSDQVTDEELITFMRKQFDDVCFGDLEYLESTCLERFSRAVQNGGLSHRTGLVKEEYETLSEETRWEKELYYQALEDLF